MNQLTCNCLIRRSKILIVLLAALFGITTIINNFVDYSAYADFIGRILSMSDTVGNDSRRHRAITSGLLHHRLYWAIITLEIIFTFFFLLGTLQLVRNLNASRIEFHEAKKFAIAGFTIAIFTYQFFYSIILNEWFDMAFAPHHTGYEWARNNIEYMFLGLMYLLLARDS
jgi:predicted small integral membrane protein